VLMSKGAPPDHGKLNVEWTHDTAEPLVNGVPHFVNVKERLHLFRNKTGMWTISPDVDAGIAFAIARTTALHPNTIRVGEWQLPGKKGWANSSSFKVCIEGPNTEECPYDVHADLGEDFFLRVRTTKVIWYKDPSSGEVVHSGAKASGNSKRLGKRYCPLCRQCYSANNFVSQHVKNMHTPPAPTAPKCYPDGKGGVQIIWRADDFPEGARAVSFFVQFSVDNGEKWSTGIEDTHSAEPRAHISSLSSGMTYVFRVGAIGLAAHGRVSEASEPFNPEQAALLMKEPTGRSSHPAHADPAKPPEPAASTATKLTSPLLTVGVPEGAPSKPGSPSPSQPPPSPPLTPPSTIKSMRPACDGATQATALSGPTARGPGGTKRGHGEVSASRGGSKAGESLAAIDLMWSLDDLCREALSAEDEGERAFERLLGASKRSRLSSEEMLEYLYGSLGGAIEPVAPTPAVGPNATAAPVYRSLDQVAQHNPREDSIARLSAAPSELSRDQAIAVASSYKAQEAAAAASTHRGRSGSAEPKPPADPQEAAQKLIRLRHALVAAPPRAKNLLLTPTLLTALSKAPHHRRELALLLSHASNAAVEAAAADSVVCDHEANHFHGARALPAIPLQPSVALLRRVKRGPYPPSSLPRSTMGWLMVLAAALVVPMALSPDVHGAVSASTFALSHLLKPAHMFSPPPPPPPPACRWSWFAGCVPANAATAGCRLDPSPFGRLCKPALTATDLA